MGREEFQAMDAAIVGGGAVGLSCAHELAAAGYRVVVLEKRSRFGEGQSSRNSQVVHRGIYYEPGSRKARLCVAGWEIMIERLPAWGVAHRFCGKMIVATTDEQLPILETLLEKGHANGADDLTLIDAAAANKREPHVALKAALLSPRTGIFDAAEYLHQLAGRAQAAGALLLTDAQVVAVDRNGSALTLHTRAKGAVQARTVVNAAGLYSDEIARLCGDGRHRIHPCRGEYAAVIPARAHLIDALVYPVPAAVSLGVHLTKTVHGELWVGPTSRFIDDKENYEGERQEPNEFFAAAHRLCPALRESDLRLGQTGIRAKRYGPGEADADFFIERQVDDPRILHLVGIESPGLTASPAIGRLVCERSAEVLGPPSFA